MASLCQGLVPSPEDRNPPCQGPVPPGKDRYNKMHTNKLKPGYNISYTIIGIVLCPF